MQCMNGRQLAALLSSEPLQGVLEAMDAKKVLLPPTACIAVGTAVPSGSFQLAARTQPCTPCGGGCHWAGPDNRTCISYRPMLLQHVMQGQQQAAWRAVVEQQCESFAVAEAALQEALRDVVDSGRAVASLHRGRVLQPADVLQLLQAPAIVAAASSDIEVQMLEGNMYLEPTAVAVQVRTLPADQVSQAIQADAGPPLQSVFCRSCSQSGDVWACRRLVTAVQQLEAVLRAHQACRSLRVVTRQAQGKGPTQVGNAKCLMPESMPSQVYSCTCCYWRMALHEGCA